MDFTTEQEQFVGSALTMIVAGNALPARFEDELEAMGLIVQNDQPYAALTQEGIAFLAGYRAAVPAIRKATLEGDE